MSDASPRVGIVGLGQIGGAICRKYGELGLALTAYDTRPEAVQAAVAAGATAAEDIADVAASSDVVMVTVRDDAQTLDVVSQLVAAAVGGSLVAIMATVTPETIARAAAAGAAAGVDVVDAPVAGKGMMSIEQGTMAVLVGGSEQVVGRLEPVVAPFGHVIHAGALGSGAVLKLAHNVMIYGTYVAAIEAIQLAAASGVRDGMVELVTTASGTMSEQARIFVDIYEQRRHGFRSPEQDEVMRISAALLDKDLGHAIAVASAHGLELPVSSVIAGTGDSVYLADTTN